MPIVETNVSALAAGIVAYGYLIKASAEHEDALEDIQLGQCPEKNHADIASALAANRWAAELFADAHGTGKTIVGYQVATDAGDHWADRMSFEILDADMALQDLIAARAVSPDWRLVPISEGDVEEPTFLSSEE